LTPEFREINTQIVKNAQLLSEKLLEYGFDIATG
jgi:glycine/serine hydroxymethyltransferase